ncbi:MAG: MarR family transcriptional regulator [Thaumarchaeota archaeon]|nr:MarR family transcriptional regulator [Nitrososphaerota archaeon]
MSEQELPPSDRLLLMMHNLGVIHEKASKTLHDLSQITKLSLEQLTEILSRHEESGYLETFTDQEGSKRYFLTGRGIIRVCSVFT